MKLLNIILLLGMMGCHSSKKSLANELLVQKATYQKYVPGESGGKGVMFTFFLHSPEEGLDIHSLIIDGEELKFSVNIKDSIIQLEASRFYADPTRDPESNASREEFEKAPLFKNTQHTAEINYTSSQQKKQVTINEFQELPMQFYP